MIRRLLMIERLRAIFEKRTKLIIIVSGVVLLCLIIAIPTGLSIHKKLEIKKQQVLIIKEFKVSQAKVKADKIIDDKRIADKKITDKKIADKIITDKKIADDKLILASIEATRIADKIVADEKARVARLNEGITLSQAYAIGKRLYPTDNLKSLNDSTQLIRGKEYYVFKFFDLNWQDEGSDWYFCVKKSNGEPYRYYSDNTLMVDDSIVTSPVSTYTAPVYDTGMTLEQARTLGYNLKGDAIYPGTQLNAVYDYTVVINNGDFYVFDIDNSIDGNEAVSWRLCISKASGKAFKQLSNGKLKDYY
jgi:hypothetical protein